jgi:hypothetical protein
MCLRLIFLLTTRLTAWLRLARHEETWKTAEILILRHQLSVLQRQQPRRPRLDWADRGRGGDADSFGMNPVIAGQFGYGPGPRAGSAHLGEA